MARGASRAVSAEGLAPSPDDRQTAEALAQVVEAAGEAAVVVMGDARDAAGVAGALAAYLGLPLVAGVRDFAADPDDPGRIVAHRKTDKTLETLLIAVPALITVSAVEDEKNVPSMKQMLAAKKAPVEKVNCAPKWEAVQGRGAGPSRNGDREDGAAQAAGEARKDLRRARRAGGKRPRGRAVRRRDPVKDCGDDEQHLDCGDEAR